MLHKKNRKSRWCVVGAGAGGQAIAACLALNGQPTSVLNRSAERLEPIRRAGGIRATGEIDGLAPIRVATTSPERALRGARMVMVAVPATAHRWAARMLAPHLTDDHVVVLNPGRTGGAFEFINTLSTMKGRRVTVAEASTLMVASRITGPGQVHVYGFKRRVSVAALPATETTRVCGLLRRVFPQFCRAASVLETSLGNIGALFHPIPSLFNAARIEDPDIEFEYYRQGVTPAVGRVIEIIDAERLAIASELGVKVPSTLDWLTLTYGATGLDLATALGRNPAYRGITAPDTLYHRYLLEDVPTGLVPMAQLGQLLGVATPAITRIVDMAGMLLGIDFWSRGRTLDRMGLSGLAADELRDLAHTGYREGLVV